MELMVVDWPQNRIPKVASIHVGEQDIVPMDAIWGRVVLALIGDDVGVERSIN
jgi:hypothetical protein